MSDIRLFELNNGVASEVHGSSSALEKSLQTLIEKNLETFLQMRFVASEYSTGSKHRGRIDTLALDENDCPVIIEYKRATNENVMNQGLYYLDWLLDHKAEFELLIQKTFDRPTADRIDWSAPRLLCIAGGYTKFDEHAVQQINRNIELIRYRRFGDDLLLFELVNVVEGTEPSVDPSGHRYRTIAETISTLDGPLKDLYDALRAHLMGLGDDVQEKTLKYYIAFKRLANFVCVDIRRTKGSLALWLKVDPSTVVLEDGFSRDVSEIGHYGTGNLELTIASASDLDKAKPLLERAYEEC